MKKNLIKILFIMLFLLTVSFTFVFDNNTNVLAEEVTQTEEVVEPSLNIYKKNISYSSEIYIMYAVSYEGIDASTYPVKMLFFDAVQDEYTTQTAAYVAESQGSANIVGVNCQIFASNGLAAKQMTDDIYARAYVEVEGQTIYSEVVKYSVLEYYHEIKEEGVVPTSILNLLEAMINYGAAAQINFNYNTEKLANATYYKVSVENTVLPDGFTSGRFKAEEQVTLTAPLKEGYVFKNWTNANGDIVSTEATYTLTVVQDETLTVNYEEEVAVTPVTLTLTKEAAYDATADTLELPATVTFDYNNETVTENVTWDTTPFVVNQIGKQKLYGTLSNDSYKVNELSVEIDVLPYTFSLDEETNGYSITKYYGALEDLILPLKFNDKNITKIGAVAFYNCNNLKNVEISSNIINIGNSAFNNCTSLLSITIPKSIEIIGNFAFNNCNNLMNVYYFGTIENWCNVKIYENYSTPMYFASHFYTSAENSDWVETTEIIIPDTITEIDSFKFYGFENVTRVTIPSSVKSIGKFAFYGCSNVAEIVISDGVMSIGDYAFGYCGNLMNVYYNGTIDTWCNISFISEFSNPMSRARCFYLIDENNKWYEPTRLKISENITSIGNYQFYNCKKLINIDLPNTITKIGAYAFSYCSSLQNFEIPINVSEIGGYAFYCCTNIQSVKIPEKVLEIKGNTFNTCTNLCNIEIPEGILSIDDYAFYNCSNLSSIILPEGITNIGSYAFYKCKKLTSINLPNGIINIGRQTFYECSMLTNITLPEGITNIGSYAFYKCINLNNINIPSSVSKIEDGAFAQCEKLYLVYNESNLDLKLGNNSNGYVSFYAKQIINKDDLIITNEGYSYITTEEGFVFEYNGSEYVLIAYIGTNDSATLPKSINGCEYNIYKFANGTLKNIIIPAEITNISDYAFYNCTNVLSIELFEGVKNIGKSAFQYCSNLLSINIPNSVTSIGVNSFYNCASLIDIIIPSNVETISEKAFYNCANLLNVEIKDGVVSVGKDAFWGCSNLINIKFPSTLTTIESNAFGECRNLTSIILPISITDIGNFAFRNCVNLKIIYNFSKLQLSIGSSLNGYVAYYAKYIHNELPREIELEKEVAYDATVDNLDLPESVSFKYNEEEITQNVTWDTSTFIVNQIGEQVIYGTFNDDELYDQYNIKRGGIYFTIDVLPYTFTLDETTNEYAITKYYGTTEEEIIPAIFSNIIITSIGEWAFSNCSNLTSITIPSSVTSIERNAFYNCSSLTNVYYEGTIEDWCNISFSSNLSNPMSYADHFYMKNEEDNWYEVTEIVIPETITEIGDYQFYNFNSIETVIMDNNVTSVGREAFAYCTNLKSIEISNNVNVIGYGAFRECTSMTNINLPASITSINSNVFYNCRSLTSIKIPHGVTYIGYEAFYKCQSLIKLEMPSTIKNIDDYAFTYASSIDIYYYGTIEDWCNITFESQDSNPVKRNEFYMLNELNVWYEVVEIEIPNTITTIGSYQFSGFSRVKNIIIPNTVNSIGVGAFYYCESLTHIEIPNSVTMIQNHTFNFCKNLTSIVLPNSVTSVGFQAFNNCNSLTEVYFTGNEDEWNTVVIDSSDYYLTNATIHYNYVPSTEEE